MEPIEDIDDLGEMIYRMSQMSAGNNSLYPTYAKFIEKLGMVGSLDSAKSKVEAIQGYAGKLDKSELDLIMSTIEKHKKGLVLYLINVQLNYLRPIDDPDDKYTRPKDDDEYVWLMPRIAEKIQERFDQVAELDAEHSRVTRGIMLKIDELHERVGLLIKNGHDSML